MNIQGIGQSYTISQFSSGTRQSSGFQVPPPPPDAVEIMEQDDANEDGVLTIEETPLTEDMFASADSDSDGQLTSEELEEMLASAPPPPPPGGAGGMEPPDAASIFETDDVNGDGVLTIEETPLSEEMFTTADADGDGQVSSEELEAYLAEGPPETASPGTASGGQAQVPASTIVNAYETANLASLFTQSSDYDATYQNFLSGIVA